MGSYLVLTVLFVTVLPLTADSNSKVGKVLQESINATLRMSGDLTGIYNFSGQLNVPIIAESEASDSKCSAQVQFRKVKIKQEFSIEVWPQLICNLDGQKRIFKLHRSYLKIDLEVAQNIVVKHLDKKVQNVVLEFQDLSLQKGK